MKLLVLWVCLLFISTSFAETPKEDFSKKLIWLPIAYYTPETQLAGGVLFIKNLWKEKQGYTSHLLGAASVTINSQYIVSLTPRLYFDQNDWEVNGLLFYSHFPNRYYGRANENPPSQFEKYTEDTFTLGAGGGKNIISHLYIKGGVAEDLRKITDFESGGKIQSEIAQLAAKLEVLSLNLGLEWDHRDYPQAPREGSWYRLTQSFYDPKDREGQKDLARFRKIELDLRQYLSLAERWTGSGQFLISEVQGALVPFQYLNFIGGGSRLRGFYAGQYRDQALGLLQAELRYEWKDQWIPSIFAGTGRLAGTVSGLNSASSFYSGGVGMNYILDPENRTKLRLDLGFTNHDSGVYFVVGEAF